MDTEKKRNKPGQGAPIKPEEDKRKKRNIYATDAEWEALQPYLPAKRRTVKAIAPVTPPKGPYTETACHLCQVPFPADWNGYSSLCSACAELPGARESNGVPPMA